jgi:hypothetical protein
VLNAQRIIDAGAAQAWVLFLRGSGEWVALRNQRIAPRGAMVRWDYHVVAVGPGPRVYDPDSYVPLGARLSEWIVASTPGEPLPAAWEPLARCVRWDVIASRFGSDRRHMRWGSDRWTHEPPQWPPIRGHDHSLPQFLDPENTTLPPFVPLTDVIAACRW